MNFKNLVKNGKNGEYANVTLTELRELVEEGLVKRSPINRDPDNSPWGAENYHSFSYQLFEQKEMYDNCNGSRNFVGLVRIVGYVENDTFYITDGGHTLEYIDNLRNLDYKFKKYNKEKIYTKTHEWGGKKISDIMKDFKNDYEALVNTPITVVRVKKDPILYCCLNNGKTMSKTDKTFAKICENPTYKTFQNFLDKRVTGHSVYSSVEIGTNKNGNLRNRVNNNSWIISLLTNHSFEKSGEAMAYIIATYNAKFLKEIFDDLFDVITGKEFDNLKNGNSFVCNRIHGFLKFATVKMINSNNKYVANSKGMIPEKYVDSIIGENNTTNPDELEARKELAKDTIQFISDNVDNFEKLLNSIDLSTVSDSGAGHKGAWNSMYNILEAGGVF